MNPIAPPASAPSRFNRLRGLAAVCAWLLLAIRPDAMAANPPNRSPSHCDLCLKGFVETAFRVRDAVTGETKMICHRCIKLERLCYTCGMPILKDKVSLEDGRHYCARDARTAVFDTNAVLRIARETDAALRRQFRDFLELPEDDTIERRVIDRIELQNWHKVPGRDHQCPQIVGLYEPLTNGPHAHRIHLLSGMTVSETRATYAHEIAHAWMTENIPAERKLDRHATEGFCELIAHLFATGANDTRALEAIATNAYTRGQFALFRAAHDLYALPAIIDWLKFGGEPGLERADLDMVRRAGPPPPPPPPRLHVRYVVPEAVPPSSSPVSPDVLELKAIVGTPARRTALINGRAFQAGETGPVWLGGGRVKLRCLEIDGDKAVVELIDSGEKRVLKLPDGGRDPLAGLSGKVESAIPEN